MNASELVNCINSVKTELQGIGLGNVPVGTADSWNLWIDGRNTIVIQACDILLSNAFSVNIFLKRGLTKKYWQGQDISKNATHSFFDDIMQALNQVQAINAGCQFWVGETGITTLRKVR